MKIITFTLLGITALTFSSCKQVYTSTSDKTTIECSVKGDGNQIYTRFLNLWSEQTQAVGENGQPPKRQTRNMSAAEQLEARDCLKKADLLDNCKAIQILELFYRFGVSDKELGTTKNIPLANKYLERKNAICKPH